METKLLLVVTVLLAILVPEPAKSSRDEDLPAAMVRSRFGFGGWVGGKAIDHVESTHKYFWTNQKVTLTMCQSFGASGGQHM